MKKRISFRQYLTALRHFTGIPLFPAILVLCLGLAGCVPLPLPHVRSQITLTDASGRTDVRRQGIPVQLRVPMALQPGDEIETYGNGTATIRYSPEGHEVRLMQNTHVQIHSIFVFIGEIFVRARGFFRVENEFVELDVEGTQFRFAVDRNREVSVAVAQGSVRCRSKADRWRPFRVQDGEAFIIPPNGKPEQVGGVRQPQDPEGWCCIGGKLARMKESDCNKRRGTFYLNEKEARKACRTLY